MAAFVRMHLYEKYIRQANWLAAGSIAHTAYLVQAITSIDIVDITAPRI